MEPGWEQRATDLYRVAFGELTARWAGLRDVRGEYYADDLREALLDLKQAVISGDYDLVVRASDEIKATMKLLAAEYPEA